MAPKQLLLPSPLVKMDNALARASWPDGGQYDLDLVMHIASKIRMDDEDFQTYSFPVSELGYGERLDGRTYKRVKDALERLAKGSIKVEGKGDNFYFYSIFTMTGYEEGKILVRFAPELKPFFLNLSKNFTVFELLEFRMLPSEYSKRLFLLLKSYSSMGSVKIDLKELHDKLNTPESFKNDFRNFRIRVLEKAQKDLRGILYFTWEPVKQGRAVTGLNFIFDRAKVYQLEREKKEKAEAKQKLDFSQLHFAAIECSREKDWACTQQTNKKKVCEVCVKSDLCSPVNKRGYEQAVQQGLMKDKRRSTPK